MCHKLETKLEKESHKKESDEVEGTKPKIDIGFRVGRLTVEEKTDQRRQGYNVWRCRCDCGGEILLDTRALQRGKITSCGCEAKERTGEDLTGLRFGKLICLGRVGEKGGEMWRCRCDCGRECLAAAKQLLGGEKKSCGCLRHPPLKRLAGRRFGALTVIAYDGKRGGQHYWQCRATAGTKRWSARRTSNRATQGAANASGRPPTGIT